jgi:steroid 5-alpha reductase family enzyme
MLHNALVLVALLVVAALVALIPAILRGERDWRGWWDGVGIVIFILLLAFLCLGAVQLGWLRQL